MSGFQRSQGRRLPTRLAQHLYPLPTFYGRLTSMSPTHIVRNATTSQVNPPWATYPLRIQIPRKCQTPNVAASTTRSQ
ncbi:hypothetical protein BDZ97DRAFT_1866167 [Flammula alnicola]|nr:hypothetical protein BDZ97DRAFT_1866167 [Flammula alnicola]